MARAPATSPRSAPSLVRMVWIAQLAQALMHVGKGGTRWDKALAHILKNRNCKSRVCARLPPRPHNRSDGTTCSSRKKFRILELQPLRRRSPQSCARHAHLIPHQCDPPVQCTLERSSQTSMHIALATRCWAQLKSRQWRMSGHMCATVSARPDVNNSWHVSAMSVPRRSVLVQAAVGRASLQARESGPPLALHCRSRFALQNAHTSPAELRCGNCE